MRTLDWRCIPEEQGLRGVARSGLRRVGFTAISIAAIFFFGLPGNAQTLADRLAAQDFEVGGLRFYGATVFTGWASSANPLTAAGAQSVVTSGAPVLGPDENYGVTASVGWQYHRQRTDISVMYSGSYQGLAHYSDLNAYSQSLAATFSRSLTPKWRFTLSASGQDSTLAQYLFQPSTSLAEAPSSFNDLAAAASIGQFTSNQIAAMLTGSPILQSPASNLLMGNRILSYSLQASLQYRVSSRLRFNFASFSAGGQNRNEGQAYALPNTIALPRSLGLNAAVGFSYSLSPRTEVGINVDGNRIDNLNQKAYSTDVSASIGRKMGMHWFLEARGGGSQIQVIEQSYGSPKTRNIIGGGSIGFRTYRHSLVGSYDRNSSDTYGFAVGTIVLYAGTWMYHAPGSRWTLFSTYSQQQIRNTGFLSLSGWEAGGGLTERLSDRVSLSTQYMYLSNTGTYQGSLTNFAVHSVRMSLGWNPQPPHTSGN